MRLLIALIEWIVRCVWMSARIVTVGGDYYVKLGNLFSLAVINLVRANSAEIYSYLHLIDLAIR